MKQLRCEIKRTKKQSHGWQSSFQALLIMVPALLGSKPVTTESMPEIFRGCEPRYVEKRINLDEVSIVSEDRLNRGHLAPGRGRPAPRSPRPWARTTRTEVTSPMGEDDPRRGHLAHEDPRRGHLAHGRGRPSPRLPRSWARTTRAEVASRSPRPWARTTRTEVTSPMGEDDPRRGRLTHGRGRPASRSPRPWARTDLLSRNRASSSKFP
ncbi:hypothetical protein F2Q69_00020061 [Brassica cretica]|uniref:Uncharacterized protein n=1 Tax=Brassica cretica TaxID=69181 RepID=A0A8S9Q9X4_BRACR|nr:hypothetical protein F2Q69_00020061 [Brassica cretica]